ncbi:MAG: hypothetical protein Q8K86_05085 [Candidatus Nanopelagicaceae bacterium]|nr:hypothetical protein [Candidatus Nanopelagicaceae bacterium]
MTRIMLSFEGSLLRWTPVKELSTKMKCSTDPLLGLKENVIIGKLIPPGTGLARYRNIRVEPTEESKATVYAAYDEYDITPFESQGSGEAERFDEFEVTLN